MTARSVHLTSIGRSALFDRLGKLDGMTMIPVPPLLVGAERGGAALSGDREEFPVPSEVANPDPAGNLSHDGVAAVGDLRACRCSTRTTRRPRVVGV